MPIRKEKLTKRMIAALVPEKAAYILWDQEVSGLGLRVTPLGAKSYVLQYRLGKGRGGQVRKPTIAKVSDITLDQARATETICCPPASFRTWTN